MLDLRRYQIWRKQKDVAPGKRVSGPRFIEVFQQVTGVKVVKGLVEKSGATAR